jgi:uncharacterized membrane protein YphA (DoxX/SURF4 family)
MFLMSAAMKLRQAPELVEQLSGPLGYPASSIVPIGVVELVCTILYAVPRTSVLGAVLLTGYLRGAVATHVRISEGPLTPILIGVVVWAGLYLRDARVRALMPIVQ